MFKNPLRKYQQGGDIANAKAQFVQVIAEVTGAEPEDINNVLNQIAGNKEALELLEKAISMAKEGNPEGIEALRKMFPPRSKTQFNKQGGKIHAFICKHAHGGVADCGCKQKGGTFESKDKQVKITNFGTAQADTTGVYDYPSTNGKFQFNPMGRTATVWDNTGMLPLHRYADENWINRHPRRQMLPRFLGGHRELAPEGFFENLVERVNNRTPQIRENGGKVEKAQEGEKIFNLIHQIRDDNVYQSHQYGNPNGHPDNNWTYERLITPQKDTVIRRSHPIGYTFTMSSMDPTHEIVTYTPTGELRAIQDYKTRDKWNRENSFHDSANYPKAASNWVSPGSYIK